MELAAYIVMAAVAYVVLLARNSRLVYGWFILFVVYSLVARLATETTWDMSVYFEAAEALPPLTFYKLREPVVWFGTSFVYFLSGSHIATFLAIDILSGIIVMHAMKSLDNGDGRLFSLAPTIISSYVFLLGQQNIYRQHVAFALLLWAVASAARNRRGAIGILVLSMLAHNGTALAFGYWMDAGTTARRRYGPLITISGVMLMGLLFPYLRKSTSATGLATEYLYVAIVAALGLLLMYTNVGRLTRLRWPAMFNFLALVPAIGILGSAQFERVAMMFLVLLVVDLYRFRASIRLGDTVASHLAVGLLIVPVFIFPSAFSMLQ